jgi:hypothetical protein
MAPLTCAPRLLSVRDVGVPILMRPSCIFYFMHDLLPPNALKQYLVRTIDIGEESWEHPFALVASCCSRLVAVLVFECVRG